jgi:hypothetical protein
MIANLVMHSRLVAAPLAVAMARAQTWLDELLVRADAPPAPDQEGQPKSGGFPVWAIVLIAAVALLCLLPVCTIVILTLLGPAIGNVFSGIVEEI